MIKFTGDINGSERLIGFCLARRDWESLLCGQYIEVDLRKDMNLPFRIVVGIFGGETDEAIAGQFAREGRVASDVIFHTLPESPEQSGRTDREYMDWLQAHPHFDVSYLPSSKTWVIYDGQAGHESTERIGFGATLREAIQCAVDTPYRKASG